MKLIRLSVLLTLCFCYMTPAVSRAQAPVTGEVSGTIQTAAGVPLAGAVLTAMHMPSGTRRTITTDLKGQFGFAALLAGGPYVLHIVQPGFRSQVMNDIFLKPDQPAVLTFKLEPSVVALGPLRPDR